MEDGRGRALLRQGFILLFASFLLGFGIVAGGPRARGWMGIHVTIMLTAVIAVVIGLAWDRFALGYVQRRVLYWSVVVNGYWGLVGGVIATVYRIPGPVSGGGVQPAPGWPASVFFTAFLPVITVLPFVFSGLAIYGLRGKPEPKR